MIKNCVPFHTGYKLAKESFETIKSIPCIMVTGQSALVAQARNALINDDKSNEIHQTMGNEFSHFFFVDSDIGYTEKHLQALINLNTDIACLPYLEHKNKNRYVVFDIDELGIKTKYYGPEEKGVKEIGAAGAGCMLIRAPVFSRMKYPWFQYGVAERNGLAQIVSEDIIFCMKARALGYKIICDFDNPVFHAPRNEDFLTDNVII